MTGTETNWSRFRDCGLSCASGCCACSGCGRGLKTRGRLQALVDAEVALASFVVFCCNCNCIEGQRLAGSEEAGTGLPGEKEDTAEMLLTLVENTGGRGRGGEGEGEGKGEEGEDKEIPEDVGEDDVGGAGIETD